MRAYSISETLNFERGLDPKDAMKTGNKVIRDLLKLKKYEAFIKASGKFKITRELPSFETMCEEYNYAWSKYSRVNDEPVLYYSFSFSAIEEIGPDCKYCNNDFHYGEIGHFILEYVTHRQIFFISFENNGDEEKVHNLEDIKKYLGL